MKGIGKEAGRRRGALLIGCVLALLCVGTSAGAAILSFRLYRLMSSIPAPGDDAEMPIEAISEPRKEASCPGRMEALLADVRASQMRLEAVFSERLEAMDKILAERQAPEDLLARKYAEFGELSAESGDFGAASGHYRESLDYRQSNDVLYAYAESLYRADPDVRDDEEIIASLKTVLALEPRREDALELLGAVSLEDGDVAAAEEAYAVLYDLHPRDGAIAAVYGRLLMHRGRFADAVGPLTAAAETAGGDPSRICDLGNCLAALERHGEAVEAFGAAILLDAYYPPSYLGMAESRLALGLGRDAAMSAAAYCALREGDYEGYLIQGDAYSLAGEKIKAETAWTNALNTLEFNSRADVERCLDVSVRLASSLRERGRARAALARSLTALEYGESPELLRVAAWAAGELGDAEAAEGYERRLAKALETRSEGTERSS